MFNFGTNIKYHAIKKFLLPTFRYTLINIPPFLSESDEICLWDGNECRIILFPQYKYEKKIDNNFTPNDRIRGCFE